MPGKHASIGLSNPDRKVVVELEDVEYGLTRRWGGTRSGTFYARFGMKMSVSSKASFQGLMVTSDPAGWLKFYLLRWGWKRRTIKWLISKSFSFEAADNASHTKYDKKTERAILSVEVERRERNAKIGALGIIVRSLSMTKVDRERERAELDWRVGVEGGMQLPMLLERYALRRPLT